MAKTPLTLISITLSKTVDALSDAGDPRAASAEAVREAFEDFRSGRADTDHAAAIADRLEDETVLFDLIEASAAASARGTETGAAYAAAAHRLLDIETAVLRDQERRVSARPRASARGWASR